MSELLPSLQEQERADLYGLLAALLLGPERELVVALGRLPRGDVHEDTFAQCWDAMVEAAGRLGDAALAEYDSLFIAPGTPRLNPYQCFYLGGWLADQPLARLRDELQSLGLQRAESAVELEDHLGALCETMRVLIEAGRSAAVQHAFFDRNLAGWSGRCLQDIAAAPGADFYRAVAGFAQAFLALESEHVDTLH